MTSSPSKLFAVVILMTAACRDAPAPKVGTAKDTSHVTPMAKKPTALPAPLDYVLDLNGDGRRDTIRLNLVPPDAFRQHLAPMDTFFESVTIMLKGYGRQTITKLDTFLPWTKFDARFADSNANAVKTRNFFLRKIRSGSVLILFGATNPVYAKQEFTVIKIDHNNARRLLVQAEQLELPDTLSCRDLDRDCRLELIPVDNYSMLLTKDTPGGRIGPYDPTYIYTIGDTVFLNKPLTRKYNEEHYVFAGYHYTDSIKVFYPDDRKKRPRLWKR